MNLREAESCLTRSSSKPQYGQRFQPSGYVFLQEEQRMLLGNGMRRSQFIPSRPSAPLRAGSEGEGSLWHVQALA
jgi:hypothetical protein